MSKECRNYDAIEGNIPEFSEGTEEIHEERQSG